jgi:hydrogenase expression/formation protein HypD
MPCVATGFEPPDVLEGVADLVEQISRGENTSTVQYKRIVKPGGNPKAWGMVQRVFAPRNAAWRGLGVIPKSGLALRPGFAACDAIARYNVPDIEAQPLPGCRCGDVLRGVIQPPECPLFREKCTPRRPLGPCMVSSEGACAARYKYG